MTDVVLLAQLVAAGAMAGVICVVQLLVYPTFATVDEGAWRAHHDTHSRRITWVVLPPMAVQLAAAAWIAVDHPRGIGAGLAALNLALVLATWLVTARVSVREHTRLGQSWDAAAIEALLRWNRLRVVAWLLLVPVAFAIAVQGT